MRCCDKCKQEYPAFANVLLCWSHDNGSSSSKVLDFRVDLCNGCMLRLNDTLKRVWFEFKTSAPPDAKEPDDAT